MANESELLKDPPETPSQVLSVTLDGKRYLPEDHTPAPAKPASSAPAPDPYKSRKFVLTLIVILCVILRKWLDLNLEELAIILAAQYGFNGPEGITDALRALTNKGIGK